MKLKILLILALFILVTAGTAWIGQAALTPVLAPLPTAEPTLTLVPTATPTVNPTSTVEATPVVEVTPTADPLPTHSVERPSRGGSRDQQPSLLDQYMPEREVLAETEHFIFYTADGYFPVDPDWFITEAENVYAYVSQRLDGRQVKNKIALGFMPSDERTCPVRGLASHRETPIVLVYADEESTPEYILAVLAHELGHAIPSEGFPGGLPDDQPLTEGLATWASGQYWADYVQVDSLHDLVRASIAAGTYEPIRENVEFSAIYPWHEDAGENCLRRRDQVYTQWGSFLGYLVETYGWEKAYTLFQSPEPQEEGDRLIEFPPDYEGVYGKSLNQLEFDWLKFLQSRPE